MNANERPYTGARSGPARVRGDSALRQKAHGRAVHETAVHVSTWPIMPEDRLQGDG